MGGSHWKKDNSGKRFGNITVLYDSGIRQNRKVVWTCQCDCGVIFNTRSDHINTGKTISCPACAQKRNTAHLLTSQGYKLKEMQAGDRYGKLTLLEKTSRKNANGCYYWKCQCDCGTVKEIDSSHWGKTISCGCIKSKGETKIRSILLENKIIFETEKTFQDCYYPNTGGIPRFDFYLPEYNLLIEFDGKQHYESSKSFWCTEEYVSALQEKDTYKNIWAKEHGYRLKRIPYYDLDNIDINYLLN